MRCKLLILILALTAGTNALIPEICAAHCMASARTTSAHHHQTNAQSETRPIRESARDHARGLRPSADCAECASTSGNGPSLASACSKLAEMEALKEGSFSLDEPRTVAPIDSDQPSGHGLILLHAAEPRLFPNNFRTVASSPAAVVSFRV